MKNYMLAILFSGMFLLSNTATSQESGMGTPESLEEKIVGLDAQFWNAYNSCSVEDFNQFLTEDLEFYHDKGGLTKTSAKLIELVKNNLCADPNTKLRREAVKGTIKVFPLNNYGAIITGDHLFYETKNGNKERLVESAKFTHVWQNESGKWRMSRVLSYDHQQTNSNANKGSQALSLTAVEALIGTYSAPKMGTVTIVMENNTLRIKAGRMNSELFATSETSLFIKEAPVRFEFTKDANGKANGFTVFENGKAVEKAERVE